MKPLAWSDDDRVEFENLVTEALTWPTTAERRAVFLAGFDTAYETGRVWAKDVMEDFREESADSLLKREQAKRRPRVPFSHDGRVLGRVPREMGIVRRGLGGAREQHRTLFDLLDWDELRAKAREFETQGRALMVDAAAVKRLLELELIVPGAANPAEACEQLGTTVEEWLAG